MRMKEAYKILIFIILVASFTAILANFIITVKRNEIIKEKNEFCKKYGETLTSLSNQTNIEYCYCYYSPCSPNEKVWERTSYSCICNCTLKNGTTSSICLNVVNKKT